MGADHDHGRTANRRRLGIAALMIGSYMIAEFIGGYLTGSLALIADAAHMLTDFVSLLFAWWAFKIAAAAPTEARTYGNKRLPVLVAFGNAIAIFMLTLFILYEAIGRLNEPVKVLAGPMMVVAVIGLAVNVAAFWVLMGGQKESLNVRGALLHVLGDMLGSVAAIAAAGIILLTGWMPIDPILSVFVALLIVRAAWRLMKETAHILLEGTPPGLEPGRIRSALTSGPEAVAGIRDVRHIHVWALDEKQSLVTLHATLADDADPFATVEKIKQRLLDAFGIDHTTVEIDRSGMAAGAGDKPSSPTPEPTP